MSVRPAFAAAIVSVQRLRLKPILALTQEEEEVMKSCIRTIRAKTKQSTGCTYIISYCVVM